MTSPGGTTAAGVRALEAASWPESASSRADPSSVCTTRVRLTSRESPLRTPASVSASATRNT
ncbi:MAG TPA: hypothetical protein VG455_11600 [Acidimicrobiales bacterium]|nr:hypothetical protein [Acidimicrobiales bacterium]